LDREVRLLEALASENTIIAHDNEFNHEVCENLAFYFKGAKDLADNINELDLNHINHITLKKKALQRASDNYSWRKILDLYMCLFRSFGGDYNR
jgi:rhamnosyltransferase